MASLGAARKRTAAAASGAAGAGGGDLDASLQSGRNLSRLDRLLAHDSPDKRVKGWRLDIYQSSPNASPDVDAATEANLRQLRAKVRAQEAEILNYKADTLQLKQRIDSLTAESEALRLDIKREREHRERDVADHAAEKADLQRQRRFLLDREESLTKQLAETDEQLTTQRQESRTRIQALEDDVLQLKEELARHQRQAQSSSSASHSLDAEIQSLKAEIMRLVQDRETLLGEQDDIHDLRARCRKAEESSSYLEQEVTRARARIVELEQARSTETQQQLSQGADARLLRKLQADNQYYRETVENNSLLQEKLQTNQRQLARATEQLMVAGQELAALESSKDFLQEWQKVLEVLRQHGAPIPVAPSDLAAYLDDLHRQLVVLQSSSSHASSSSHSQEFLYQRSQEQLAALQKQHDKDVQELDALRVRSDKLQRQLDFNRKEKEGLRGVVDSYNQHASTITKNVDKILFQQLEMLKGQLQLAEKRNAELETLLEAAPKAATTLAASTSAASTSTKILRFKDSPVTWAKAAQVEELKTLRSRVQELEAQLLTHAPAGNATQSNEDVAAVLAEREALRQELQQLKTRMERLKDVFQKKVTEFRVACYELLGFNITVTTHDNDTRFELKSMYAERPQDTLIFQHMKSGMQLLGTEHSRQWQTEVQHYLVKCNSIPAFLSAVTSELFSRTTMA